MTNSISTTVVEVTKNINDTVIMASWQPHDSLTYFMSSCHDKDTDRLGYIGLCQDVITKTS